MIRFELLNKTRVHVVNVHPRREKHGDDNKPAVDIKFRWETTNASLGMFDPHLVEALYFKGAGAAGQQQSIEGVPGVADLPNLRFPLMLPFRWDQELTGYKCRVDYGTGGKSDLVLDGCDVNKFLVTPKEGGTVVIDWRVQCSSPDEKVLGKLSMLIDMKTEITLVGPELPAEGELGVGGDPAEGRGDGSWPFPKGKAGGAAAGAPPQSVTHADAKPGAVPAMPGKGGAAKKVAAVKYRNAETGETWSGRGLQPNWLKAALKAGKSLSDFEVA